MARRRCGVAQRATRPNPRGVRGAPTTSGRLSAPRVRTPGSPWRAGNAGCLSAPRVRIREGSVARRRRGVAQRAMRQNAREVRGAPATSGPLSHASERPGDPWRAGDVGVPPRATHPPPGESVARRRRRGPPRATHCRCRQIRGAPSALRPPRPTHRDRHPHSPRSTFFDVPGVWQSPPACWNFARGLIARGGRRFDGGDS